MKKIEKKKWFKIGAAVVLVCAILFETLLQGMADQSVKEAATGKKASSLWLNMRDFSLLVGDYHTLILHGAKAGDAKWTSSKPSVASVSASGKVTAKKAGKTVIRVTYQKQVAKCKITVRANQVKKVGYRTGERILKIGAANVRKYNSQQAMCTDSDGNVYLFRNRKDGDTKLYKIRNLTGTIEGLQTTLQNAESGGMTQPPEATAGPSSTGQVPVSSAAVKGEVAIGVTASAIGMQTATAGSVITKESVTATPVTGATICPISTSESAIATEKPMEDAFFSQALVGTFQCLGHPNDATYKGDDSRTGKGLYVATELAGGKTVVQLEMQETYDPVTQTCSYDYKKVRTYQIQIPYVTILNGRKYKKTKKVVASSITYDAASKRFIIREQGQDQYYVGYFKKTGKTTGKFVPQGTFRLQNTLNGGNLDFYGRQGVTYKNGILYVCKSGHTNDVKNNSLILRYTVGKLTKYKNKKGNRIIFSKQKTLLSSGNKSKRYYLCKKENQDSYKFEIEAMDFIGDQSVFITIEKAEKQGAGMHSGLYRTK